MRESCLKLFALLNDDKLQLTITRSQSMLLTTEFERSRNWSAAPWRVAAETPFGYVFVQIPYSVGRGLRVQIEVPDDTIQVHCWYGQRLCSSATPDDLKIWDIRRRHTKQQPVSAEEYAFLREQFKLSRFPLETQPDRLPT